MRRLRVLMSCHEFSPYQGSECAVGWNVASHMARLHDVTVLAAVGAPGSPDSYRTAVRHYLEANGPVPGLEVVFVDHPPNTLRYARMNKRLLSVTHGIGYQPLWFMGLDAWHHAAFRAAQELGFENFDVAHQLTPTSFLRPGYLWRSGLPFFWGPIAGMYRVPRAFASASGSGAYLFQTVRSLNIARQTRSGTFRTVAREAKRIWTVGEDEFRTVDGTAKGKAARMIDTSPPAGIVGRVRQYDGSRPLRLCWSGRHDAPKALPLLLRAIATLPHPNRVVVDVLGEGPLTGDWKNLARDLSLVNVSWCGRLPYRQALEAMGQCDVFAHTSIKEATSMVILEAMAWGLPVICHDICGMAVAVDDTAGIKIRSEAPEQSIQGFAAAIEKLLDTPHLIEQLSEGALTRASKLTWDAKVREMAAAYYEFAGERG